ncbi:MAG: C-terminal binding protein [Deferribacteres bacterium]|nr:C-terminal binding protein [candidate division KSB1 bacterium]MCB9501978.1 C-terminal binding protein [Deferribacteres bacterium]
MTSSKVWITDYIKNPDIEQEILGEQLATEPHADIEAVLVWHMKIDQAFLSKFPRLKAIIRYGVGYDNIDLAAADARKVLVCNTPDYGTEEVADTAIAMISALTRGIFRYHELSKTLPPDWQENTLNDIRRSREMCLGVIGAGRIGSSVILRAKAMLFQSYFYDPYKESGYEKVLAATRIDNLYELLNCVDIVSIHCPLTSETRGMVDNQFIRHMRRGSYLVNTARGKIVQDIEILFSALQHDVLSGVGLDVLPEEPPPADSELVKAWRANEPWLQGRLIINPHTAYYSQHAYKEMREKAAKNALRVIQGEMPLNRIFYSEELD